MRLKGASGVYVIWHAGLRPEFQEGVVKYLLQVIAPMILNPLGVFEDEEEKKENEEEDDIEPIPVFPPGMAPPKPEV